MAKAYAKPDPNPYLFEVGQMVRLRKGRSDDGQTPRYWDGAVVKVKDRSCTGLHKIHFYILQHPNGQEDSFEEDEIDVRYAKKHERRKNNVI